MEGYGRARSYYLKSPGARRVVHCIHGMLVVFTHGTFMFGTESETADRQTDRQFEFETTSSPRRSSSTSRRRAHQGYRVRDRQREAASCRGHLQRHAGLEGGARFASAGEGKPPTWHAQDAVPGGVGRPLLQSWGCTRSRCSVNVFGWSSPATHRCTRVRRVLPQLVCVTL
jgi:hypothetical protein